MQRLRIRDEQWQAFEEDAAQRFEQRVARELRHTWPDRTAALGEDELLEQVRYALASARRHGFAEQEQQTRFAHLACLFGKDFDRTEPWASTIMSWDFPPPRRLELLEKAAQEQQERQA